MSVSHEDSIFCFISIAPFFIDYHHVSVRTTDTVRCRIFPSSSRSCNSDIGAGSEQSWYAPNFSQCAAFVGLLKISSLLNSRNLWTVLAQTLLPVSFGSYPGSIGSQKCRLPVFRYAGVPTPFQIRPPFVPPQN